jgi:hypothetical protein
VTISIPQLERELAEAGFRLRVGLDGETPFFVGPGGLILQPDEIDPGIAAVVAAHVPEPPPPSKNDLLNALLDSIDPEDPDVTVLWMVVKESLT